ncbi:hypothetical protein AAFC00_005328 [Neodothiora populina]|uniref:Nuclear localization protein n=1 Tax=Neodothiora populina TaxID=2781224 RepID=A0ABR3PKI3_9PEZI
MDPSGTINPAALNALNAAQNNHANTSSTKHNSRGLKRSRSPEDYSALLAAGEGDADESKPRKRGRPPKSKNADSPLMAPQQLPMSSPLAAHTPQIKGHGVNQSSPSHASPQRATPSSGGKAAVVKALPTVRDHTTDQVGPEGDEYLPREIDDAGEQKVTLNGYLLDGREYRIRTFNVPNRGEKLFMLATECARQLGYRDSYLLFNKNRSLFKIIANQAEKDNLIHQEILPYSYRSRQIAIVTARSMFRQFGSRVIVNGRRVRDDYWESKARSQGFTEQDAAGEKRPGAAKQREAAAAEASTVSAFTAMPQGDIIYSDGRGLGPVPPGIHPHTLAPVPMVAMTPDDDPRANDFSHIIRPRQELSGPAYVDRTQPSSAPEIFNQATQAADFNKSLTQQRVVRSEYYHDYWRRPHEPPTPPPQPQMPSEADMSSVAPQNMQSPQRSHSISNMNPSQHGILPPQQPNQHNAMPSPVRSIHQQLPSAQMHQTSPAMSMSSMSQRQPTPGYGYPQGQMWPPPQPQPSPLSQAHHLPQYNQHMQQQTQQSPMPPPSQMGGAMGYGPMNPMSNAFPGMNRSMYQPSPSPQHFNMAPQASPAQQGGMQGWAPPPSSSAGLPHDWQRYQ